MGFKLRFIDADEQHMSPCPDVGETKRFTAIQYSCYGDITSVDAVLRRTEEAIARTSVPFTSHWGKLTHSGHAKINGSSCLSKRAKLFNEKRKALDPDDCFLWDTSEIAKILLDSSSQ